MPPALPRKLVDDITKSGTAKGEVAPLVRTRDESSDETGDNQDDAHEQSGEDVRERQPSRQE